MCREVGHLKCLLPCSKERCSGHYCDRCEPKHKCHTRWPGWRPSFDRDPDQEDDYRHRLAAGAQKHDAEFGATSHVARSRFRPSELMYYRATSIVESTGGRMLSSLWQGCARHGREGVLPQPETGGSGYGQLALQDAEADRLSIDIRIMEMRERLRIQRMLRKDPTTRWRSAQFYARCQEIMEGKTKMTYWQAVKEEAGRKRARLHRLETVLRNSATGNDGGSGTVPVAS